MPQTRTVRILIVDDHPIVRYGLKQLISSEPDLEVFCEAGSAAEGVRAIEDAEPDLLIADINLPDKNGLEMVKDLKPRFPNLKVLIVSMYDEGLYAERALRAGARGYIMKEAAAVKLIEGIRAVLGGRIFLSAEISSRIVEAFANQAGDNRSQMERLSDRELEVFRLIGEGKGSRAVAELLNVSVRTVDAHRAHIKEKLGLADGNELVRNAVRWVETGALD